MIFSKGEHLPCKIGNSTLSSTIIGLASTLERSLRNIVLQLSCGLFHPHNCHEQLFGRLLKFTSFPGFFLFSFPASIRRFPSSPTENHSFSPGPNFARKSFPFTSDQIRHHANVPRCCSFRRYRLGHARGLLPMRRWPRQQQPHVLRHQYLAARRSGLQNSYVNGFPYNPCFSCSPRSLN